MPPTLYSVCQLDCSTYYYFQLKLGKQQAISAFVEGQDVFVCYVFMGFGKSLCFVTLPEKRAIYNCPSQ